MRENDFGTNGIVTRRLRACLLLLCTSVAATGAAACMAPHVFDDDSDLSSDEVVPSAARVELSHDAGRGSEAGDAAPVSMMMGSGLVGPKGGTITTPSGVELEIPPGALSSDVEVTIKSTAQAPAGAVGTSYLLGPEGLTFATPVTITLPFEPSLVPEGTADLTIMTAPKDSPDFHSLGGWVVDGSHVRAYTTHFSAFVAGSPAVEVVASRETYPTGIATDGTRLFYSSVRNARYTVDGKGTVSDLLDGGALPDGSSRDWALVMRMLLVDAGEAAGPVRVPSPLGPAAEDPRAIAIDSNDVFYTIGGHAVPSAEAGVDGGEEAGVDGGEEAGKAPTTGGMVVRISQTGGPVSVLSNGSFPTALALVKNAAGVATSVLFSDWGTGQVLQVPSSGGATSIVADGQGQVPYLSIVGDYVYWTSRDTGTVMRRALAGGELETLATGQPKPEGIAADDTYVYWGTLGLVEKQGALFRAALPTSSAPAGEPEQIRGLSRPAALLIKGDWLTVADFAGWILQHNRITGLVRTRAVGQLIPSGLAADDKYIYWTNLSAYPNGSIVRMPADRCSVAECALSNQGCSPATGLCVPTCPEMPVNARDFFVDATGIDAGNGSQACPFKTIRAAMIAVNASAATGKTVRVAPGLYNASAGETFPIELRGVSLIGSGSTTIIEGSGAMSHVAAGGSYAAGNYRVTLVAGDETARTTIYGATIRPASGTTAANAYGIFCDRGNAGQSVDADAGADAMAPIVANTNLDLLTIGPSYAQGVVVTSSRTPASGCNLTLKRSTVLGNATGLRAVGCTQVPSTLTPVAVEIGSMTAGYGNKFAAQNRVDLEGVGIQIADCTRSALIQRNVVTGNDVGVQIRQTATGDVSSFVPAYFDIRNNELSNQLKAGIMLGRATVVEQLSSNTFTNTTLPLRTYNPATDAYQEWVGRGAALLLDSENAVAPFSPRVKRARGNTFVGNDTGILIRGASGLTSAESLPDSDFGTESEPGGNVFRCNSTLPWRTEPGYDVYITSATRNAVTVPFVGNQWDRAVPWMRSLTTDLNGADVVVATTPAPGVSLSAATISNAACPAGRNVGGVIDNSFVGFSVNADPWLPLTNVRPKLGQDAVSMPSGTGANAATWTFTGVRPGNYRVAATWPYRGDFATRASFAMLDGTTPIATIAVNERLAPNGSDPAGFRDHGVAWQYLGAELTVTGTRTIVVRMSDEDAGGLVVADAVRLELVSPL